MQYLRLEIHRAIAQHHQRRCRCCRAERRAAQSAVISGVMDQQSRGRRTGVISIVVALVLVSAFWGAKLVRYQRLEALKSNARPWETLASINPPAGARKMMGLSTRQDDQPIATAMYSSNSDCEAIKAYYRKEFDRHGFVPKAINIEPQALGFCGSHYYAVLSCKAENRPLNQEQPYMVLLRWTNDAC